MLRLSQSLETASSPSRFKGWFSSYAPINVKPAGGVAGHGVGI